MATDPKRKKKAGDSRSEAGPEWVCVRMHDCTSTDNVIVYGNDGKLNVHDGDCITVKRGVEVKWTTLHPERSFRLEFKGCNPDYADLQGSYGNPARTRHEKICTGKVDIIPTGSSAGVGSQNLAVQTVTVTLIVTENLLRTEG